ncbi:hypothetical protein P7M70_23960, partial [Vibrio parahaemolyticus]|nr:hypothetical protein [Vibrio parahaemolyticus]
PPQQQRKWTKTLWLLVNLKISDFYHQNKKQYSSKTNSNENVTADQEPSFEGYGYMKSADTSKYNW